jgi:outer membrane protein
VRSPATAGVGLALALVLAAGPVRHARADAPAAAAPAGLAAGPTRLTLAQAVGLATGNTAPVEVADLKLREAAERRTQARAALLPSLGGSASIDNRTFNLKALGFSFPKIPGTPAFPDLIGPVDAVDARVRATQALFDWSSWVRVRAATVGVGVSGAERDLAAESAAQAASLAYLRALRAAALADARRQDLALADQLRGLAVEQRRAGASAAIDVTRAETQLAAARGDLLLATNVAERARIDLARALGLGAGARPELADSLGADLGGSAAPEEADAVQRLALERRPELRVERLKLRRARAESAAIGAERLPRIEVAGNYGLSGEHWPDALATREVSVAATMPIFDGLRRESRIGEQRAVIAESEVRERDLALQVEADVAAARLDLASGRDQQTVAAERVRLAEDELAQARERFASGVAGNIEVIEAQASLLRARDAEIEARYAVAAARINLARAAGVCQSIH